MRMFLGIQYVLKPKIAKKTCYFFYIIQAFDPAVRRYQDLDTDAKTFSIVTLTIFSVKTLVLGGISRLRREGGGSPGLPMLMKITKNIFALKYSQYIGILGT